jgi:hypothetical protein
MSAPSGAVAATASLKARRHGERLAAILVRRSVEDQDAVEVVELVLSDPRRELLELELDGVPLLVARLDAHPHGPLDAHHDALHGQAALVIRLGLLGAVDDHRVDDRARLLVLGLLDDEDTA